MNAEVGRPATSPPRLHYAWVVALVTFAVLLVTAGIRATPGILIIPLEREFGWSRTVISAAIAINIALMGIFDILGTTASGWLTDRYSSRHLLFAYYTLRGLSLLYLPFTLQGGAHGLGWFAVFYGLDWIATVPPTVRLAGDTFGRENTGVVYGWIAASHQLGASLAALGAGAIRTSLGDYRVAFWIAGVLCVGAGLSFLTISRRTFVQRPPPRVFVAAIALND